MAPKKLIHGSEIARLVLGYLEGLDQNLFLKFLEVSPYLPDIRDEYHEGSELLLTYRGLTLTEILNDYENLVRTAKAEGSSTHNQAQIKEPVRVTISRSTLTEDLSCAREPASQMTESSIIHPSSGGESPASPSPSGDVSSQEHMGVDFTTGTPTCLVPRSRSRSCSDVRAASPSEDVKRARRRFLTPYKREEPSDDVAKQLVQEFLDNRNVAEKLAESINHAWAEVGDGLSESEISNAIQSIVDKATACPSFNEVIDNALDTSFETTLETQFDMLQFLKPKRDSDTETTKSENLTSSTTRRSTRRRNNVSAAMRPTAEALPYPDIRYEPVDRNIYIADLDSTGNVSFYSNPLCTTPGVFLPPAPPGPPSRFRRIQPKPIVTPTNEPVYNVLVCTPMMPPEPPTTPAPAPSACKKKLKKAKQSAKVPEAKCNREDVVDNSCLVMIPATPGHNYTDNMPTINFLATPQHPPSADVSALPAPAVHVSLPEESATPSPPKEPPTPVPVVPEVTPIPPVPSRRPKKSQSTPRRKSYIRTLEFETPQKEVDLKKCATSPKRDPPPGNRTPTETAVAVRKGNSIVAKELSALTVRNKENASTSSRVPITDIHSIPEGAIPTEFPSSPLTGETQPVKQSTTTTNTNEKGSARRTRGGKAARGRPRKTSDVNNPETYGTKNPIATMTPQKASLSGFWDPLNAMIGNSKRSEEDGETQEPSSTVSTELTCLTSSVGVSTSSDPSLSVKERNGTSAPSGTEMKEAPGHSAWDSGLRALVGEEEKKATVPRTVRRRRKIRPAKSPKRKKQETVPVRVTRSKSVVMSPSKKHAKSTTKRNTYAISHGSSSAFETSSSDDETMIEVPEPEKKSDFSEITPAKIDIPLIGMSTEETPITKLLRENIGCMDVDLSMIQTPVFPPTPSINLIQEPVTPIHETRPTDYSSSSSYYKPDLTSPGSCLKLAVHTVEDLERSEEHLQDVSTISGRNLVLTPEEPDVSPTSSIISSTRTDAITFTRQNKITNYYKQQNKEAEESETSSTSVTVFEQTVLSAENSVKPNQTEKNCDTSKTIATDKQVTEEKKSKDAEGKATTSGAFASHEERVNRIIREGQNITYKKRLLTHKNRLSGKNLSLLKLQMIAKCDSKLSKNIPISADNNQSLGTTVETLDQGTSEEEVFQTKGKEHKNTYRNPEDEIRESISHVCDQGKKKPCVTSHVERLEGTRKPLNAKALTTNVREALEIKRQETIKKIKSDGLKRSKKPLDRPNKKMALSSKKVEVLPAPRVCSTPNKCDPVHVALSVSDVEDSLQMESPIGHQRVSTVDIPTNNLRVFEFTAGKLTNSAVVSDTSIHKPTPTLDENMLQVQQNSSHEPSQNRSGSTDRTSSKHKHNGSDEIPPFVDDGEFPELPLNTKKKLFAVKFILQLKEVVHYLKNYGRDNPRLRLKSTFRGIFKALFIWLQAPREDEVISDHLRERIKNYLDLFKKISEGVSSKSDRSRERSVEAMSAVPSGPMATSETQKKTSGKTSGRSALPTHLPLKKRRRCEKEEIKKRRISESEESASLMKTSEAKFSPDSSGMSTLPGASKDGGRAPVAAAIVPDPQIILQDVDLDRFLSRVHGHDSS